MANSEASLVNRERTTLHPELHEDPEKQSKSMTNEVNCDNDDDCTGWRRNIREFTASWFTITTGTGIVSVLLFIMPYNSRWMYWLSIVFFALNVALFSLFSVLLAVRFVLFPSQWNIVLNDSKQSLFLSAIPLGFSTIIVMATFVCVPAWGVWCTTFVWTLWWINSLISLCTCCYLPWVIMNRHSAKIQDLTALWLFPIVATGLDSAVGSAIAGVLPDPRNGLITLIFSYILFGTFFPFAMIILTLYFHRLTMHHLPPRHIIVSVFMPVGPAGMGGFAIMRLGKVAMDLLPRTKSIHPLAGQVLYINGFITALILWGFGIVWLFFAVASIAQSPFPFNMGYWGFTFPLGTMALATIQLGREIPSRFLAILGIITAVTVILLWIMCAVRTVWAIAKAELFFAPCLHDLRTKEQKVALKVEDLVK